uniref:Uncharacterized protein n=1 Tax=Psilocybe cubensis TaxID=181762 RepID=A0A8H7XYY2_PSICU
MLEARLLSAGNDAGVGSAWVTKDTGPPPSTAVGPGVGVGDESEKSTASSSSSPAIAIRGPLPNDTTSPSSSSLLFSRLSVTISKAMQGLNAGLNAVSNVTATALRPPVLVHEQTKVGMGTIILSLKGKGKEKDKEVDVRVESESEAEGAGAGKRERGMEPDRRGSGRRRGRSRGWVRCI